MSQQPANQWHGCDPDIGAPYDTYVDRERNVLVMVDTDGSGGLVETVIGPAPPLTKPGKFGTPAELREEFRKLDAMKENSGWSCPRVERETLRALREIGPATKEELVERLRLWTCQVSSALTELSRDGLADYYPHPDAGGRKYLWRSTDTVANS